MSLFIRFARLEQKTNASLSSSVLETSESSRVLSFVLDTRVPWFANAGVAHLTSLKRRTDRLEGKRLEGVRGRCRFPRSPAFFWFHALSSPLTPELSTPPRSSCALNHPIADLPQRRRHLRSSFLKKKGRKMPRWLLQRRRRREEHWGSQ